MTKFKHFSADGFNKIQEEINEWLKDNPSADVISHAHTRVSQGFVIVSIIYKYG